MSDKIDLQYLAKYIAERHGLNIRDAETFVRVFFSIIEESLRTDGKVSVKGLGTFRIDTRLSFTPEDAIRDVINRPFEHFETVLLNDGVTFDDVAEIVEEKTESPSQPEGAPVKQEEAPAKPEKTPAKQEDDPLQRMIAEAVEEKRKREEIVTNIYSKREESPKAPVAPVEEKPRKKRDRMKYVVNGILVIVFAAIFGCGFLVLKMYFPEMFVSDGADNTAEVDQAVLDFQQIVLSDTTIVSSDDSLNYAEPQDTSRVEDSAALAVINTLEKHLDPSKGEESREVKPVAVKEVKAAPAAVEKTTQAAVADKTTQAAAADKTAVNNTPVHPDSVSYKIKGTKATHTLQPGETLTRVSLKYYGTKDLYPYIVKYNSDVIKNQNNVPVGTVLKIPDLVKK